LSGYYLSKVLDLEEHLLREHYLKYNLRFQWKTEGYENTGLEDYNKSFIRFSSNIATFQLDRNILEAHMLEVCKQDPRFQFEGGVERLDAEVAESAVIASRFRTSNSNATGWLRERSPGRGPSSDGAEAGCLLRARSRFMRTGAGCGLVTSRQAVDSQARQQIA